MNLMLVARAIVCGLFLISSAGLRAQSLAFNSLAGYAGAGSADGMGTTSRFNNPGNVALDSSGNLYVADADNHTIRQVTPAGVVTTIAGLPGVSGTANGVGNNARFNQPLGVAVDTSGSVYVADSGNHAIRKLTAAGSDWSVSTLAGVPGVSGSGDGTGGGAFFYEPEGVAADTAGNVYVADTWNHTIRKVTSSGTVTTLAGSAGNSGTADAVGSNARFYQPQGITVDSSGIIYVADTANHTIRKVTSSGSVTTLAGSAGNYGSVDASGTSARFYQPTAVAVDGSGNVYVADYFNSTVRMVTPTGAVRTLAGSVGKFGSADGTNSFARFRGPQGIAAKGTGTVTLYVADSGNGTIRSLTSAGSDWTVSTWAGSPSAGAADGAGNTARFEGPGAVALSSSGAAYVADSANSVIRLISAGGGVSSFAGVAGNSGSADGTGAAGRFNGPQGMAQDTAGNLYVADTLNATIREINPAGFVTTLAGSPGNHGPDDGTGSSARFYRPTGIAVDSMGYVYVSDTGNQTIRKLTPGGAVSTLAGLAGNAGCADGANTDARFNGPAGIAVDSSGNLFVSDFFNHTVRKVAPDGSVTTIAGLSGVWGSADGMNSAASFFEPADVAVDAVGSVYVVDSGNHTIRKLTMSGANWIVTTVAGLAGVSGSTGGLGTDARFAYPMGIARNNAGLLCVADTGNNTISLGAFVAGAAPTILVQPQSQSVNVGGSVTFAVPATGSLPLSYQWSFNSAPIAGATDSTLTRDNVEAGDFGTYAAVVSNALGNVTSSNAVLTLSAPPLITTQPQSQSVLAGQSASFNVIASGTPQFHYQWRYNDTDIPGANSSTYAIGVTAFTNAGNYSVVVSNSAGLAVSSEALLMVTEILGSGDNSLGQLNISPGVTNVITITAGSWHNLALEADGTVVAWGDDSSGQCDVPPTLAGALAIAAGGYHSVAIKSDCTLALWGANDSGQTNVPKGLSDVIGISAGTWHTLALRRDGTVVAWGDNSLGQTNVPTGLNNVVAVAAGGSHSLALKANGIVAAWGDNNNAHGDYAGQSVVPPGLANVVGVSAGGYHSVALRADGTVFAWGDNSQGQCNVPAGLSNVVALAAGGAHTLALKADGHVVAWGANQNGQCDVAATAAEAAALAAGESHSLVLSGGTLPFPLVLKPAIRSQRFSALAQTLSRKHYVLEFNTSIPSAGWSGLSTNAGNGALLLLTDPAPVGAQGFYRVGQW